jgi:hypothetical protein
MAKTVLLGERVLDRISDELLTRYDVADDERNLFAHRHDRAGRSAIVERVRGLSSYRQQVDAPAPMHVMRARRLL